MSTVVMKVFEEVNGQPLFFKHTNNKSRKMPLNKWIRANNKLDNID